MHSYAGYIEGSVIAYTQPNTAMNDQKAFLRLGISALPRRSFHARIIPHALNGARVAPHSIFSKVWATVRRHATAVTSAISAITTNMAI